MPLSYNAMINTAVYGRFSNNNDTVNNTPATAVFNGNVFLKKRLVINNATTTVAETIPALTSNSTTITGQSWLNGVYVCSTSRNLSTDYYGFDKVASTYITLASGEYMQIQTPYLSVLSAYTVTVTGTAKPLSWVLYGSLNGTTWVTIDTRTGLDLVSSIATN